MCVRVLGADAFDDHRQGKPDPHPVLGEIGMAGTALAIEFEQRADAYDAGRCADALGLSGEYGGK
ncbi:hypothetical protein A5637_25310 [Mycolicibacterium fortuitum]|nr:hypothetical protein A5665_16440 [Mycolicibacterium fortuitum]OBK10918.1 hypothetical protein A5637_25310 [Mycolicibacterium fortuitum]OMC10050.1 hypothetical protein A5734_26560 [Mycolicibacterium fortuitum]